jgi:hypothetical protein
MLAHKYADHARCYDCQNIGGGFAVYNHDFKLDNLKYLEVLANDQKTV